MQSCRGPDRQDITDDTDVMRMISMIFGQLTHHHRQRVYNIKLLYRRSEEFFLIFAQKRKVYTLKDFSCVGENVFYFDFFDQ